MKHIARSSLILAFFFGLTKIISIVRNVLVARAFGLSGEMDAFNAANNLPDLLSSLISGGALALAFIPILSEYLEKGGRPAAWGLFSRVANLAFVFALAASLLIALLAEPLVRWKFGIAPGFTPERQALVVSLMRLDLIGTLIFAISGLVMAGLQANQHFLFPAMAPALYSLGQIFGALILAPSTGYRLGPITLPGLGMGVYGLVYGVILGALLHLGIQLPALFRYQFRWAPRLSLRDPGVKKVLVLMGPSLLAMLFFQLNFVARDNLASRLGVGPVTALTYGWFIMQVPQTLIGTVLSIVLLPTLSELIARGERDRFRDTLNQALRVILALTLPAAALLAAALKPLVQVLFGFDAAGTHLMVTTTLAFLGGVVGYSLVEVGVRSFYAQQKPLIPLLTSALQSFFYISLAVLLYRRLGTPGIGLSDSLIILAEGSLLFYLLNRRFPGLLHIGPTLIRVVPASALCALGVVALVRYLPLHPLLSALGALSVGGLAMLPFIWPEIKLLIKL